MLNLYYARAVNNKLLCALRNAGSTTSSNYVATKSDCDWLLDYCASIQMMLFLSTLLVAHSDTAFNNETRSRSCAGAHIFLSADDPFPRLNGTVLYYRSNQASHVVSC